MIASVRTAPIFDAEELKQASERRTVAQLSYYVDHPLEIDLRLHALDEEWPIERILQANAGLMTLTGVFLGAKASRGWLLLPALCAGFLVQHAATGDCPPARVLRRLGFRSKREIEQERYALKALRGDFERLPQAKNKVSTLLEMFGFSAR